MWFWNRKKEGKVGKYEEIPFQHLAPIDSVEDKTIFDALDYALSQNNVHNIALTGNYGSGKSSILESYIKRNRKKNDFLKISLATFAVENKNENIEQENIVTTSEVNQKDKEDNCTEKRQTTNSKSEFSETILQKIEKSILQQILYRKSGIKLPNSRFIRIKRTNKVDVAVTEIVILAIFFVSNYFIHGKFWDYICRPLTIPLKWDNIALSISLSLALFLFLYKIILFAKRLRIAKLCFNNAEIEFKGSENEESLLNKYLDELLYFFEVTKYNVVVFEDLDRFNNTEIFIKLRELNTLLNNYEKINRKIIFVYALRDEVFKDYSRTKFFDFIIPVIPVINNQNSSDILLKLRNENLESPMKELDENFLQDIGLYVDDMRLLKNSINEFKIYDKKINEDDYKIAEEKNTDKKISRNRNKIFALILYKNLYPNDFALLAQNKGNLYQIIQKKWDVAKEECSQINLDVQKIEKKIQEIEKQIDLGVKELRTVYVSKIFSKKPDNSYLALNVEDFVSDEKFDEIKNNSSLECLQYVRSNSYYNNGYNKQLFGYDFSNIEKEVNSQYSYDDRVKMIKSKNNGELQCQKNKLKEKKFELSEAGKKSIKDLLKTNPAEKFTDQLEKQDEIFNKFVIYLLRNGFIDENYFDFISYFYANALNEDEKQYLLSIKNCQQLPFWLPLRPSNIEYISKRIKESEWMQPAVLNYSMLIHLLSNKNSHLADFINTLWTYKKDNRNKDFLSEYSGKFENLPSCVWYVGKEDPRNLPLLYKYIYENYNHKENWLNIFFDDENKRVLYNFFIYVEYDKTKEDVGKYLVRDVSFLHRDDIDNNVISSKIIFYGLKFNLLEDSVKYPIYNVLLNNDAYLISKNNFDIIIKHANGDTIEESIKDYYTQISKLKKQNIKAYVDQNIDIFVNDIVLSTGDSMAESEEAFIELLNDENLMTETKVKLIEKNRCIVSDITKINSIKIQLDDNKKETTDMRNLLYKHKKVSPTWSNVFENFKYNGNKLDPCLVEYLNDEQIVDELTNTNPLTNEELKNGNGNYEIASKAYQSILYSKDLSLDGYAKLMNVCPWAYKSTGSYDIESEKMGILIEQRKLLLTLKNYSGIKQNYSDLLPKYIRTHFEEFVEKWSELNIVIEMPDLKRLLDSFELDKDQKVKLMNFPFELWGSTISKEDYIWLGKKIIELNISQEMRAPILSILQNTEEEDDLIKIICLQGKYHYLHSNDIVDVVNNKMNEHYQACIKREGKREKIPYSKLNEHFCAVLREKEIISSYQIENDKIRVIQRRP